MQGNENGDKIFIKKLMQQAKETEETRHSLYDRVGLKRCKRILDVGCGSGAITLDISKNTNGKLSGIDISKKMIYEAKKVLEGYNIELRVGDAHDLPFKDESFDLVVCNLLLMWVKKPQQVVNEMVRVSKKWVLATLEPDYGGRITYLQNDEINNAFSHSIKEKGGNPYIGRQLRKLFVSAGLETEMGISNTRIWSCEEDKKSIVATWDFYESVLKSAGFTENRIKKYYDQLMKNINIGWYISFFPEFYAIGRKKE